MSGLGNFLPAEQDLLIGIFFRVGRWISHVDDTDISDLSEQKEQGQMARSLARVAGAKEMTDLVRELAGEAMRRSGDQGRWLRAEEGLLADIARAVKLVQYQGTEEDFACFRKAVMFVASSVARAYREEPEQDQDKNGRLGWLIEKAGRLMTAVSDREAYRDMNISPAEDTALHQLNEVLAGRSA